MTPKWTKFKIKKQKIQLCFGGSNAVLMHSELFTLIKNWILMVSKNDFRLDWVFLCQIYFFRVRISFGKLFWAWLFMTSQMAELCKMRSILREKYGSEKYGTSPRRLCAHAQQPEREQERAQRVFGCEGKITLFCFPNNSALREQWMQFVLLGQQQFRKCVW